MNEPIIEIGGDGVKARVFVGIDVTTGLILAFAMFLALTAALLIYAKIK